MEETAMDTQAVAASAANEPGSVLVFRFGENQGAETRGLGFEATINAHPLAWPTGSNAAAPIPSNWSESGVPNHELIQTFLRELEEARNRLQSQSGAATAPGDLHFADRMLLTGVRERLQRLGRERRAAARARIEAELSSIDFGTADGPKLMAPIDAPPPGLSAVDVEFMMSVLQRLTRMSPEKRSLALCNIQRVMHQIEFES